jgi:hypothetical protein
MKAEENPPILSRIAGLYHNQLNKHNDIKKQALDVGLDVDVLGVNYYLGYSKGNLYDFIKYDPKHVSKLVAEGLLNEDKTEILESCLVLCHFNDEKECIGFEGVHLETKKLVRVGATKSLVLEKLLNNVTDINPQY